ncbi:MAG: hypothetical protein Q7T13_00910 [Polaromonas sp.]|nr:hypothetical protein [Polaromonas sp.]
MNPSGESIGGFNKVFDVTRIQKFAECFARNADQRAGGWRRGSAGDGCVGRIPAVARQKKVQDRQNGARAPAPGSKEEAEIG